MREVCERMLCLYTKPQSHPKKQSVKPKNELYFISFQQLLLFSFLHFDHNNTQLTAFMCVSQVQCYDPEADSWLLRANIPIAKRCITAVSLNNLIYVCGGLTKSIFCYDPIEDYWIHVVHTFNKQVMKEMKNKENLNVEMIFPSSKSDVNNPPSGYVGVL